MMRLILVVSLWRCRSLPKVFIQGFSAERGGVLSLSWTASVTNWRNGIPRSAATDFARRKIGSGISSVVFMHLFSHIYGSESKKHVRETKNEMQSRPAGALKNSVFKGFWWTRRDSNPRPPRCEQWGK